MRRWQDDAVTPAGAAAPDPEQLTDVGGGIRLCWQAVGSPDHPTMVLVTGLGFGLVAWPDGLCERLAARGFHVVRFDSRDVGRSTRLPGASYSLADMAGDVLGLLDAIGVRQTHLVGASMGGMVAQVLAARHPERVLSLASLMSTTGNRRVGRRSLRVLRHALGRRPKDLNGMVERRVRVFRELGSTAFEHDVEELRRTTLLAYEREGAFAYDRGGRRRQHAAVKRAGDRTAELATITAPTVVIHGTVDRMVHPSGGEATAAAIPDARLVLVEGLGHDLPPGAWGQLVDEIVDNARRAGAQG